MARSVRGSRLEPVAEHHSSPNQCANQRQGQNEPSPMLHGMAQHAQERAAVMAGDVGDSKVSGGAAHADNRQESTFRKIGSARGRKKHAGRRWNRDQSRGGQRSRTPLLEKLQEPRHFALLEFLLEISLASFAGEPEGEKRSDQRSRGCRGGILIPQKVMRSGQDGRKDVRTSKGWDRGTI